MVRFLRCPGVVVDLGSAQLARGPCVLAREGPTSEPRPLPHAGPAPPVQRRVASGWRTAVWMASIKVPSSMEGWGEEGLITFPGPRCSADADRGRYWPLR